jgi:hypothetical protein
MTAAIIQFFRFLLPSYTIRVHFRRSIPHFCSFLHLHVTGVSHLRASAFSTMSIYNPFLFYFMIALHTVGAYGCLEQHWIRTRWEGKMRSISNVIIARV